MRMQNGLPARLEKEMDKNRTVISTKTKTSELWSDTSTCLILITVLTCAAIFAAGYGLIWLTFFIGRLVDNHFGWYITGNSFVCGFEDFVVGMLTIFVILLVVGLIAFVVCMFIAYCLSVRPANTVFTLLGSPSR